jgi:hypothetical protein
LTASKKFGKIVAQEREKRMYEIGDYVVLKEFEKQITGQIVSYHYDDGIVWVVRTADGNLWDCADHELAPAVDAYGHPWTYRPTHNDG